MRRRSSGLHYFRTSGPLPIQCANGRCGRNTTPRGAWSERRSCSRWACSASPRRQRRRRCGARSSTGTSARRSTAASSSRSPASRARRSTGDCCPDIRWMKRRYDIFITDGYSTRPGPRGERRAPDRPRDRHRPEHGQRAAPGARSASSRTSPSRSRTQPIPPWRWVGWNGDAGHGRGNHLHLSWMHSPSPARASGPRRLYAQVPDGPAATEPSGSGHNGGTGIRVRRHGRQWRPAARPAAPARDRLVAVAAATLASGAISPKVGKLAPVVPEDL